LPEAKIANFDGLQTALPRIVCGKIRNPLAVDFSLVPHRSAESTLPCGNSLQVVYKLIRRLRSEFGPAAKTFKKRFNNESDKEGYTMKQETQDTNLRDSIPTKIPAFFLLLGLSGFAGAQDFGWGPNTATGLAGGCPIESRSGNQLFVAGGFEGSLDIFYYQRNGRSDNFADRTKVADPVSKPPTAIGDVRDFCPTPLPGKMLMFVSDRAGGCGGTDIYVSRYNPGKDQWSEPRNLGCAPDGPNTEGFELSPSLVETEAGTLLFFSTGEDIGLAQDLYESQMLADGSFSSGMAISELNTPGAVNDRQPNVSRNGLEIVFASNRDGGGDIWTSKRNSVFEAWSEPVNLSDTVPFSTAAAGESRPSFSWDGKRLYYGSGGVHVSTR
jgi:hypothetical protein